MMPRCKRFSIISFVEDIQAAAACYVAMGCRLHDKAMPHCLGIEAGGTYHILASTDLIDQQYCAQNAALLKRAGTAAYVYVESLQRALDAGNFDILEVIPGEALVRAGGVLTILADGT